MLGQAALRDGSLQLQEYVGLVGARGVGPTLYGWSPAAQRFVGWAKTQSPGPEPTGLPIADTAASARASPGG